MLFCRDSETMNGIWWWVFSSTVSFSVPLIALPGFSVNTELFVPAPPE